MSTTTETSETIKLRTPRLELYHPNGGGTGAALQLELRLNRPGEDRYNCFFMELARQKTAPGREGEQRVPATFDWAAKVTVKLEFADLCELLAVLEGRVEKAGGARSGLYHENGKGCTVISFQRGTEKAGFLLGLSRKDKEGGQLSRVQFALTEAEAIGLRCLFQAGLFQMTFHPAGGHVTSA